MDFQPTAIPDMIVIKPRVFEDERGFFMETWESRKFADYGLNLKFVQHNHSCSLKHTLRGLHYQLQHPQGKLLRVVSGEIYDVAVDLRRHSPYFGKWVGEYLSAENKLELWVPPGFAHGFLVTSDVAHVVYKCTDFYAQQDERSVLWNDPDLDIHWPLDSGEQPLLSDKDKKASAFRSAEVYP